ncbi:MAG: 50S ribosomal protein L21 [Candidatus Paceibacterota bacterium]|jgi:large subunit ribosomal protein L21
MFAVIKTGGKQYLVEPSTKLKIEKIEGKAGDSVAFDAVLLKSDGAAIDIGTPTVSGAKVEAEIVRQFRDTKKIIFKYHSKARERTLKGHRQPLTEVVIKKVS